MHNKCSHIKDPKIQNTPSAKPTSNKKEIKSSISSAATSSESSISKSSDSSSNNSDKLTFDMNAIFKNPLGENNEKANVFLYLELMSNLNQKDDVKSLAICRLILKQEPHNEKIKELEKILFDSIAKKYKENNNSLDFGNDSEEAQPMDKHMRLNKEGEWEYYASDDEEEEK